MVNKRSCAIGNTGRKVEDMRYRIEFEFYNEFGELVSTFLDDNGCGFNEEDALSIARQLREQGCRHVHLQIFRKEGR